MCIKSVAPLPIFSSKCAQYAQPLKSHETKIENSSDNPKLRFDITIYLQACNTNKNMEIHLKQYLQNRNKNNWPPTIYEY